MSWRAPKCAPPGALSVSVETRIALRLLRFADSLASGQRQAVQCFIPIARWAVSSDRGHLALVRYLLADAIGEARSPGMCQTEVLSILERLQGVIAEPHSINKKAVHAIAAEVEALAPRRRRRRSIHCHGQIASDRRLLLARSILDDILEWGSVKSLGWHDLSLAAAYAMSDYDYDHFEMIGPAVERRVRRLASWLPRSIAPR